LNRGLGLVALSALVAATGGCGAKQCKSGTVLASFKLDSMTSDADEIDVIVTAAGGAPKETPVMRAGGELSGSIEIDFPKGYPAGNSEVITLVARRAGAQVATATFQGQFPSGCDALSFDLTSTADGGAAEQP
jgi:hypothetical protein